MSNIQYKLLPDTISGKSMCILKIDNEMVINIPKYESNTDYQEYLKWLEEGNTPLPADPVE